MKRSELEQKMRDRIRKLGDEVDREYRKGYADCYLDMMNVFNDFKQAKEEANA